MPTLQIWTRAARPSSVSEDPFMTPQAHIATVTAAEKAVAASRAVLEHATAALAEAQKQYATDVARRDAAEAAAVSELPEGKLFSEHPEPTPVYCVINGKFVTSTPESTAKGVTA